MIATLERSRYSAHEQSVSLQDLSEPLGGLDPKEVVRELNTKVAEWVEERRGSFQSNPNDGVVQRYIFEIAGSEKEHYIISLIPGPDGFMLKARRYKVIKDPNSRAKKRESGAWCFTLPQADDPGCIQYFKPNCPRQKQAILGEHPKFDDDFGYRGKHEEMERLLRGAQRFVTDLPNLRLSGRVFRSGH